MKKLFFRDNPFLIGAEFEFLQHIDAFGKSSKEFMENKDQDGLAFNTLLLEIDYDDFSGTV